MAEKIITQLRNAPRQKIDLLYDDTGLIVAKTLPVTRSPLFIIRMWEHGSTSVLLLNEISLIPAEFIELLKAGLDYYEVNGDAVKKLGLQVVK